MLVTLGRPDGGEVEASALVDTGAQVSIMSSSVARRGGWRVVRTQLQSLVGVGEPGSNQKQVLGVVRAPTRLQQVEGVVTYAVIDKLPDILPEVVVGRSAVKENQWVIALDQDGVSVTQTPGEAGELVAVGVTSEQPSEQQPAVGAAAAERPADSESEPETEQQHKSAAAEQDTSQKVQTEQKSVDAESVQSSPAEQPVTQSEVGAAAAQVATAQPVDTAVAAQNEVSYVEYDQLAEQLRESSAEPSATDPSIVHPDDEDPAAVVRVIAVIEDEGDDTAVRFTAARGSSSSSEAGDASQQLPPQQYQQTAAVGVMKVVDEGGEEELVYDAPAYEDENEEEDGEEVEYMPPEEIGEEEVRAEVAKRIDSMKGQWAPEVLAANNRTVAAVPAEAA